LPKIAQSLGISVVELIRTRFPDLIDIICENEPTHCEWRDCSENVACPFLTKERLCEVHEVRPEPCRRFPLRTDCGAADVCCLAYEEFRRVQDGLFSGKRYCAADTDEGLIRSQAKNKCLPSCRKWPAILRKLKRAKPSVRMLEAFVALNDAPPDIVRSVFDEKTLKQLAEKDKIDARCVKSLPAVIEAHKRLDSERVTQREAGNIESNMEGEEGID
jgi:Fe-S-cluster containining protein